MFICKYAAVDELLHFVHVDACAHQRVRSGVLLMAYDSQEHMVRRDAVASCPHRLFPGEIYYRVELVRYADFHKKYFGA